MAMIYANATWFFTGIYHSGCGMTLQLAIYAMKRLLFSGQLVPSIYMVCAATGTSIPTMMGTIILQITDNDSDKHTFTLTHVNYTPLSPVNLLSMIALSK
jgi:hypothetical protein